MDEFSLITDYLAPLVTSPEALGLKDDAAVLTPRAGHELVITKDALVEGVHFIGTESPALIAQKALRTNLSDLAAKGAIPHGYFLALMLPDNRDIASFMASFAEGLREDNQRYNISLLGGDTVRHPDRLTLSITACGYVPLGKTLKRSGAKNGDIICVSGTLGDSAAGLALLQDRLTTNNPQTYAQLADRYTLPQPRITLGNALLSYATACADISDGLIADLGHICEASGLGASIEWEKIPLSSALKAAVPDITLRQTIALSGGDDYELVFTVPTEQCSTMMQELKPLGVTISPIGIMGDGHSVRILDAFGKEITLPRSGFRHFD